MKALERPIWDIQDQLQSEEDIAEYLNAALEEEDPDFFLVAISDVIKAAGAKTVAQRMGHGEKSLYKSIKPGAHPRYDTVFKMVNALGLKLHISAH
jgi:probable addiction module antidote protein